ncbi:MAG: hypothetical protein PHO66_06850 [Eubacteriales bacterium]|nr:hypothetical protein [Eubacteriales bacterium]
MKLAADLHIHSCLSPCADDNMTPGNIVAMAALKGLDVIAIADHNSAGNLRSAAAAAADAGMLLLPAIEANTREETHVLCYFETLSQAEQLGEWLYERLPPVPNSSTLFGNQFYIDIDDGIVASEPRLLISAADCSLEELVAFTRRLGGVAVPAHVDKPANSILTNLGFIPPDLQLKTVEIRGEQPPAGCEGYAFLRSSDAHTLGDILERVFFIDAQQRGLSAIIREISQ